MLNPGDTIGALMVQSNVLLNGTLMMELNRTNAPNCDQLLSALGNIAGGGALIVTNLGSTLAPGDRFHLFTQPVSGFAAVSLPDVTPNAWINKLADDGTLIVVSTAAPSLMLQAGGGTLTLTWPPDHTGWRLQEQTNSVGHGLGANWVDVAGSTATNQMAIPINPAAGSVFYRLVFP
jgi:hypothetical protein